MAVRTTKRYNSDGSVTRKTTITEKTPFGSKKKEVVRNYERKEHSFLLHLLLCGVGVGFVTIPYYTLSPRHHWHL